MAPNRYTRGKYRANNAGTWFNGQGTPNYAHSPNVRNNNEWRGPRMMNESWHNESPISESGYYPHSPGYSPNPIFDQRNMNLRRGTNYNQRGRDNRFGDSNERFGAQREFEPNNNYFHSRFDNDRKVFYQEQRSYNSFCDDEVENERDGNYEVENERHNEENSYFSEDVYAERSGSNSNWLSFENDIQVTVRGNVPRRGHIHEHNNKAWRQVKAQPFKSKGKKSFPFKKNFVKKKFTKAQISTPKKVISSRFDFVLADFALKPNSAMKAISKAFPGINDEFIILDQTYASTESEPEPKTNDKEILISDSSEDSLGVEIVSDKNGVNCEHKIASTENADDVVEVKVKPVYCAVCNVYCTSEKNFKTHNSSNNHLIKLGLKKAVKKEKPVEIENMETERSEVSSERIDVVVKTEEKENDERSDDDIVEVGNVDNDNVDDEECEMTWDPNVVVGKGFMVQFTGYFCKLCKKYFNSIDRASNHCRSLSHFEKCKSVKNGLSEVKEEVAE